MTEPTPREPLRPVPVPTRRIIEVGLIGWMIALVVILAVPALHTGERSWWPWCAVAGLGLGLLGYGYLRRGRGNASGAI
mgnify:CR=1 FL=1